MGNCNCDSNKQTSEQLEDLTAIPADTKPKGQSSSDDKTKDKLKTITAKMSYKESNDDQSNQNTKKVNPLVQATLNNPERVTLPDIEFEGIGVYVGEWKKGKRDL